MRLWCAWACAALAQQTMWCPAQTCGCCWVLPAWMAGPSLHCCVCVILTQPRGSRLPGVVDPILLQCKSVASLESFSDVSLGSIHEQLCLLLQGRHCSSCHGHRRGGSLWRCWLEDIQPESAGLLLIVDQLSSGFAQSRPTNP